jgi:regulation of enolase protein 1 (concanavalin A-like superfamily)
MILRRVTSSLKEQHWMTIAIELVIVIIGVFIGTQVSNWSQARLEHRQTQRMLDELVPELSKQLTFFKYVKNYYGAERGYADQALTGWKGDKRIGDDQFVIAAYQASQIYGIDLNTQNWGLTFGGEQLRDIDDVTLRQHLATVLTSDYSDMSFNAVATPYREDVRRIIPAAIQDQIRAHCGDRIVNSAANLFVLPPGCPLELDPVEAHATAAALHADLGLAGELNWHLAQVATYLSNAETHESQMLTLKNDLARRS